MKKTLSIFLLGSVSAYCSSSSNMHDFIDTDQQVLEALQSKGYMAGTVVKIKGIQPDPGMASKACRILFINVQNDGQKHSYVVKEMGRNSQEEWDREKNLIASNQIATYQSIIQGHESDNAGGLPKLITYYGAEELEQQGKPLYVTIMSKAKGKSLLDIKFTKDMQESDAISLGSTLGQQMGALTRIFYEERKSILMHGDIGLQNFTYDEKNRQLYWIDLGGTHEFGYEKTDFDANYFEQEANMFKNFWWGLFPYHKMRDFDKYYDEETCLDTSLEKDVEENGVTALRSHRLGILAGHSFFQAYCDQVKDLDIASKHQNRKDAFVKTTKDFQDQYMNKVQETFGANSSKIMSYLFAPSMNEEPLNLQTWLAQDANSMDLTNQIVQGIYRKMQQSTFDNHVDPIYKAIRSAHSDYNSGRPTNPSNYVQNIEILAYDFVLKAILKASNAEILKELPAYKDHITSMIKSYIPLPYEGMIHDVTLHLSSHFFQHILINLASEQLDLLEMAEANKTHMLQRH